MRDERDGYYDGQSGAVLRWQDGMFQPVAAADATADDPRTPVAASYQEVTDTGEQQLAITFRTVHPADERLVLGGALESIWRELTGEPPAGWGTAEPANLPWSPRQMTDLAHERAPEPTWFVVVGSPDRPGLATVRVSRTKAGVEEYVTLMFGYRPDEKPPVDSLPRAAELLATRHRLLSMLVQIRKPAGIWRCRPASRGPVSHSPSCSARTRSARCPATVPGRRHCPSRLSPSVRRPTLRCTTRCPGTRWTCRAGRTSNA